MPPKLLKAKLTKITDITPSVRELFLDYVEPTSFKFKAGQFVMLHLPQADGKIAQRAYSVASPDHVTDKMNLVIKYYDLGVASTWVKGLKGGEEINYTGPFGKFTFSEPAAEQVVFVCTSTGVAPSLQHARKSRCQISECGFPYVHGRLERKRNFLR